MPTKPKSQESLLNAIINLYHGQSQPNPSQAN